MNQDGHARLVVTNWLTRLIADVLGGANHADNDGIHRFEMTWIGS
jgi:hypothetical protein